MFCLDTNIVIAAITKRSPAADSRLQSEFRRGTRVLVPAIVLFELRFGVANSARRIANERLLDAFLSAPIETPAFDTEDAAEAANIRAFLRRKGTLIGPYDILIAAQARRRSAAMITGNVREFRRVPGLLVQDWTAEQVSGP
jgi:tRNA(fMet)-specific endonuclease VapC